MNIHARVTLPDVFHVFHMFAECFNNSTYFTIFTMIHNISQKNSQKIFCEILHTDFTEMAALRKILFAAAMLPERIPTAAMLTAASRSQS